MSRLTARCDRAIRAWQEPKPHPLTGDMLKPGERITWKVMAVYRRWSVFVFLQVLTLCWWLAPRFFPGGLPGWNYLWSDLAVAVEMLVGIAFLNQSMRDARVIRDELAELKADTVLIREIREALVPGGAGTIVTRAASGAAIALEMHPAPGSPAAAPGSGGQESP